MNEGKGMYTIKKVSELVDIPSVTIRAWEKRYQIINPHRSDGGHRLYSDKDIQSLQWLKKQTNENGLKISEAARMLQQMGPSALSQESDQAPALVQNEDRVSNDLYMYFVNLNSVKANETLDLAFSLYSYNYVFHRILAPLLYRIGQEWEKGQITVAQEHFASEIITQRFHQIFRILPINPALPKVLAFCPEGELHQLGLMLFSLFLREKGMEVIYLGANTPYSGLNELIDLKEISVVAISLTHERHLAALLEWIKDLQALKPQLVFTLGGKGLSRAKPPTLKNVFNIEELTREQWEELPFLNK